MKQRKTARERGRAIGWNYTYTFRVVYFIFISLIFFLHRKHFARSEKHFSSERFWGCCRVMHDDVQMHTQHVTQKPCEGWRCFHWNVWKKMSAYTRGCNTSPIFRCYFLCVCVQLTAPVLGARRKRTYIILSMFGVFFFVLFIFLVALVGCADIYHRSETIEWQFAMGACVCARSCNHIWFCNSHET